MRNLILGIILGLTIAFLLGMFTSKNTVLFSSIKSDSECTKFLDSFIKGFK